MERASTAQALSSAVANMSMRGVPKTENRLRKVSTGGRHSVGLGLLRHDNASVVTFRAPGRCVGIRIITN